MSEFNTAKMQIQSPFNHPSTPLSNLEKFLNNYNRLIEQNVAINFNTQTILSDIALNLLEPPQTINEEQNKELFGLYQKGKKLPQLLDSGSKQIQDMSLKFKKLKQDKLQETITFIEQLNAYLNKEYDNQVNRGVQIGVYGKRSAAQGGQNLVSNHRTEKMQMRPQNQEKEEKQYW